MNILNVYLCNQITSIKIGEMLKNTTPNRFKSVEACTFKMIDDKLK